MYHTYTTEGIVLESHSVGDANRRLLIFTKEFGLIYVSVQSVRGHLSKLRPFTQTFSGGMFTLVRGKYGWKLVNVIGNTNYFYDAKGNELVLPLLGRAQGLVSRFVALEEVQREIFDIFKTALDCMVVAPIQEAQVMESIMACRILRLLGFLTDEGFPQDIMSPYADFSDIVVSRTVPYRKEMNNRINTALRRSGL